MKSVLLAFMFTVTASFGIAETSGQQIQLDGPWIEITDDMMINLSPPTQADILVMADLDGDLAIITDDEARMISVLTQVLTGTPVTQ